MSVKRQATTELNHDNWDQDDPNDREEMGTFKTASKDVLEKRVIRTAKRRSQISDESKKSVFSGFGGFNKAQPSSFDFLANLTNGKKATNGSPSSKSETAVTSSLFSSSPSSGIFGSQPATTPAKMTFGIPTTSASPLFGGISTTTTTTTTSLFGSKADSTVGDSPFKLQTSNATEAKSPEIKPTSAITSSNIFGVSSTSANTAPSMFSTTTTVNSTFASQPVSSTTSTFGFTTKTTTSETEKKTETKADEKKLNYYVKLKGLNESVSEWIKKHVEETPLCILSPIFKDYEKYLKEIQDEYFGTGDKNSNEKDDKKDSTLVAELPKTNTESPAVNNTLAAPKTGSSLFGNSEQSPKSSLFPLQSNVKSPAEKPSSLFGISSSTTTTGSGFSFGVNTSSTQATVSTTSSPFALSTNTATTTNGSTPFSFGIGKPFSFNSNSIQKNTDSEQKGNENEDEDEPPKVEFTPVVEEGSVFDKKCKIFVKKDGNFADKGVGTLYIKKIEESGKYQLLVRANTTLGNVLLNLILASAIPTQRMGKNNVMLVCIPTPDAKPPPVPILIRVKTAEEADELLETLNKYKS